MVSPNIILLGPSGAGKTSVGLALAKLTGRPCLDTDRQIEKRTGLTVRRIFAENGEAAFREEEAELLRSIEKESPAGLILSCGGGLPVAPGHMETLNAMGLTIYLTAGVDTLAHRLGGGESRPLLGHMQDQGELKQRLSELIGRRKSVYERAHMTIDTENKTVAEVAATIQSILTNKTL